MECPDLRVVPDAPLPEAYVIRPYQPGDEAHWLALHRDADELTEVTDELFLEQFGTDPARLAARQLYLCDGETVVGTCSSWFHPNYKDGNWGRLHWMCIRRTHQGRGLGRVLFVRSCRLLQELGYTKACLTTVRERVVAVALYRKLGFEVVE